MPKRKLSLLLHGLILALVFAGCRAAQPTMPDHEQSAAELKKVLDQWIANREAEMPAEVVFVDPDHRKHRPLTSYAIKQVDNEGYQSRIKVSLTFSEPGKRNSIESGEYTVVTSPKTVISRVSEGW